MKIILCGMLIIFLILLMAVICKFNELKNIRYNQPQLLKNRKILTVYYSNGGHTKDVAQTLYSVIGGDIKEIQLLEKYPSNIFKISKLVRKQIKEDFLPQIQDIDISGYDIVFVGSPIWNFSISQPAKTFLINNNFEDKIIIPFFTYSGGANKRKIIIDVQAITKAKEVRKPLFMFENGIILTKEQVIKWLNNI